MKYKARVAHIRFEVAEIDIEIANDEASASPKAQAVAARLLAKRAAIELPEHKWVDQTDRVSKKYEPWAYFVLSEADVDPELADSLDDAFKGSDPLGGLSYVLLEADKEFGDARVILQPWFDEKNMGFVEYGLLGEWIRQLEALRDSDDKE